MAKFDKDLGFEPLAAQDRTYDIVLRAETAGAYSTGTTNAPDGADPGSTVGTWAQTATGVYTFTFASGYEPDELLGATCYLEETDVDLRAFVSSYVASTRVLTVRVVKDDGTSGVPALNASNNKTLVVWLKCRSKTPNA